MFVMMSEYTWVEMHTTYCIKSRNSLMNSLSGTYRLFWKSCNDDGLSETKGECFVAQSDSTVFLSDWKQCFWLSKYHKLCFMLVMHAIVISPISNSVCCLRLISPELLHHLFCCRSCQEFSQFRWCPLLESWVLLYLALELWLIWWMKRKKEIVFCSERNSGTLSSLIYSTRYFSFVLYAFVRLMILYMGGRDVMLTTLSKTPDVRIMLRGPPCCCCCFCCPKVKVTRSDSLCL